MNTWIYKNKFYNMNGIIKIYENFLSNVECDEILMYSKEFFELDKRARYGWHARTNRNLDFENKIKNIASKYI